AIGLVESLAEAAHERVELADQLLLIGELDIDLDAVLVRHARTIGEVRPFRASSRAPTLRRQPARPQWADRPRRSRASVAVLPRLLLRTVRRRHRERSRGTETPGHSPARPRSTGSRARHRARARSGYRDGAGASARTGRRRNRSGPRVRRRR